MLCYLIKSISAKKFRVLVSSKENQPSRSSLILNESGSNSEFAGPVPVSFKAETF
jgi:hypothetical protein